MFPPFTYSWDKPQSSEWLDLQGFILEQMDDDVYERLGRVRSLGNYGFKIGRDDDNYHLRHYDVKHKSVGNKEEEFTSQKRTIKLI